MLLTITMFTLSLFFRQLKTALQPQSVNALMVYENTLSAQYFTYPAITARTYEDYLLDHHNDEQLVLLPALLTLDALGKDCIGQIW